MGPVVSLTTSLVNLWLYELSLTLLVSFWTASCHERTGIFAPCDDISLLAFILEAMNDSLIFASSQPVPCFLAFNPEKFQAACGCATSWAKSKLYAHQVSGTDLPQDVLASVPVDSVHRLEHRSFTTFPLNTITPLSSRLPSTNHPDLPATFTTLLMKALLS
jgi:hypothetical protein